MSAADIDNLIGGNFIGLHDTPKKPEPHPFRSRFIEGPESRFIIERFYPEAFYDSLAAHVEAKKLRALQQKRSMVTVSVPVAESTKFLSRFHTMSSAMRNFIVRDVAVFDLALSTAISEARDVIEQVTGSRVEDMKLSRVQRAAEQMVELHMVNKLASVLKVAPEVRRQVLTALGAPDGKKELPDMQKLLGLLKARKETHGSLRGVEKASDRGIAGRVDPRRVRSVPPGPRRGSALTR